MKKRVIAILLANPDLYTDTVSGDVGRFPSTQEIEDAILQKDNEICKAIIDTPNHTDRTAFLVGLSSAITNGGLIPSAAQGAIGNVLLSPDGSTFSAGKLASSKDEIVEVLETGTSVYGTASSDYAGWYFIEDNRVYHTSLQAKVTYAVLSISGTPQAPDSYESAIIDGAVAALWKDGAITSDIHTASEQRFQNKLNEIRGFPRVVPEQQAFEMQTA